MALLFDGCDKGSAKSCAALAAAYDGGLYDGKPVKADLQVARYFYGQACEGSHSDSCFALGGMSERGRGTIVDLELAEAHYRKACSAHHSQACGALMSLSTLKNSIATAPVSSSNIAKKIAARYLQDVRVCHEALLKIDPSAQGKVTLTLTVSKTGEVLGARAKGFDDIMDNCIAVSAQSWTFSPPTSQKESEQYTVPLILKAQ